MNKVRTKRVPNPTMCVFYVPKDLFPSVKKEGYLIATYPRCTKNYSAKELAILNGILSLPGIVDITIFKDGQVSVTTSHSRRGIFFSWDELEPAVVAVLEGRKIPSVVFPPRIAYYYVPNPRMVCMLTSFPVSEVYIATKMYGDKSSDSLADPDSIGENGLKIRAMLEQRLQLKRLKSTTFQAYEISIEIKGKAPAESVCRWICKKIGQIAGFPDPEVLKVSDLEV